jgi:hypothetical protein
VAGVALLIGDQQKDVGRPSDGGSLGTITGKAGLRSPRGRYLPAEPIVDLEFLHAGRSQGLRTIDVSHCRTKLALHEAIVVLD